MFLYDRLVEAAREDNMLEEHRLEYPYVPPDATLVEDMDGFEPPAAPPAPDAAPNEPDGDGDGRA